MTEADIQNSIRVALSPHAVVFRINVGSGTTYDGRNFSTGAPKGYSDLSGFRKNDGKAFFIEVKTKTGKLRPEQENFLAVMRKNGALAGVARSIEDALKIIEI